jgi:hypothetical protein
VSRYAELLDFPLPILAAHADLCGLAISDEFVDAVAEALAQHPEDGFTVRMRHLLGPLSVVLQMVYFDAPDHTLVQSFPLWRGVPRQKALALAHIVGELLFLQSHAAVAVAVVDSLEQGVCFRFTSVEGDFVARDLVGLAPSWRAA